MIFLNLFLFLIFTHQILFWTYFWQIKEYRFDRFFDAINNKYDFWKLFKNQYNLFLWYRPKFTLRIFFIAFPCLFLTFLFSILSSLFYLLIITFLIPFLVTLFVYLSFPLFDFLKKRIISRATNKMSNFKGIVIGITGSFGKSSTKEILASILSQKYKVAKTLGNNNTEIGVAQTVLNLKNNPDIFIVEMGAYKIGEIQSICKIVNPKIGIITGIGNQHLSLFGSLENIKKAKYELINALPKNGFELIAEKDFGLNNARNIKTFIDHLEFDYQKTHFSVPILNKNIISNIIGAIKIALYLKVPLEKIKTGLKNLDPSLFYPKLSKLNNNIFVINDSYNANLESFLSILNYLKIYKGYKKVLITPGIIELGKDGHKTHEIIGKNLKFIDKVIITQPNYFKELNQFKNAQLVTNVKKIIATLKSLKKTKTVFLFKSRVPQVIINSLIQND
jgi:UDP-N-acetylmuramoyl-tripeptide--D-alanyl-D-alanine ligase